MDVCVCILLQQRPQRASLRGQRAWEGRMVLTGYVIHDLVVMHHRHCLKRKRVRRAYLLIGLKTKGNLEKRRGRRREQHTGRSVKPVRQVKESAGEGPTLPLPGTSLYPSSTHKSMKGSKWTEKRPFCSLPSHFWDIPHSSFHSLSHKLHKSPNKRQD